MKWNRLKSLAVKEIVDKLDEVSLLYVSPPCDFNDSIIRHGSTLAYNPTTYDGRAQ